MLPLHPSLALESSTHTPKVKALRFESVCVCVFVCVWGEHVGELVKTCCHGLRDGDTVKEKVRATVIMQVSRGRLIKGVG